MHRAFSFVRDATRGIFKVRSPRWNEARAEHLKKHPACAACGAVVNLQVHHCRPFHLFPELELDPHNLITLCEQAGPKGCHLRIGHLGKWRDYNPGVRKTAALILAARKH